MEKKDQCFLSRLQLSRLPDCFLRLKNILQRFEEVNLEEKQGKGSRQRVDAASINSPSLAGIRLAYGVLSSRCFAPLSRPKKKKKVKKRRN